MFIGNFRAKANGDPRRTTAPHPSRQNVPEVAECVKTELRPRAAAQPASTGAHQRLRHRG
jgi:hypothetical protein